MLGTWGHLHPSSCPKQGQPWSQTRFLRDLASLPWKLLMMKMGHNLSGLPVTHDTHGWLGHPHGEELFPTSSRNISFSSYLLSSHWRALSTYRIKQTKGVSEVENIKLTNVYLAFSFLSFFSFLLSSVLQTFSASLTLPATSHQCFLDHPLLNSV